MTTVYVDLLLLSVLDVVTLRPAPQTAGGLVELSAAVVLTDSTFVLTGCKDSEHHHQHLVQTGQTQLASWKTPDNINTSQPPTRNQSHRSYI